MFALDGVETAEEKVHPWMDLSTIARVMNARVMNARVRSSVSLVVLAVGIRVPLVKCGQVAFAEVLSFTFG